MAQEVKLLLILLFVAAIVYYGTLKLASPIPDLGRWLSIAIAGVALINFGFYVFGYGHVFNLAS